MKAIIVLALVASPALADVYKCKSGSKTIYQDVPCANAKVIENINGLPPSHQEQQKAVDRASRDRSLAAQLSQQREAKEKEKEKVKDVKVTQMTVHSSPAVPKRTGPDRYYDRPDRFENRTASGTYIQRK